MILFKDWEFIDDDKYTSDEDRILSFICESSCCFELLFDLDLDICCCCCCWLLLLLLLFWSDNDNDNELLIFDLVIELELLEWNPIELWDWVSFDEFDEFDEEENKIGRSGVYMF